MPQCVGKMVQVSNLYLQMSASKILNKHLSEFGRKPKNSLIVDSGSSYTLVDMGVYESIPQELRPELEETDLRLRSANGQILKVHGKTVIKLLIGNKVFESPVKVVSLGDIDVILGLDFMSDHDCVLYLSKGILQVGSKSLRIKLHKQSDMLCARIQIVENVNIPPLQEMLVCGKISDRYKKFDSELGAIEQLESLPKTTGLQVAGALIDAKQENVPVKIVIVDRYSSKTKQRTNSSTSTAS